MITWASDGGAATYEVVSNTDLTTAPSGWTPVASGTGIANDGVTGRSDRGGYGLVGMEERVRSLGGQIAVGPAPQNTWSVVARTPWETTRTTPSHMVDPIGDGAPGGRSD